MKRSNDIHSWQNSTIMTNEEVLEFISAHRKLTGFIDYLRGKNIDSHQRTLYRAVEAGGRTPRQRMILDHARQYVETLRPQQVPMEC